MCTIVNRQVHDGGTIATIRTCSYVGIITTCSVRNTIPCDAVACGFCHLSFHWVVDGQVHNHSTITTIAIWNSHHIRTLIGILHSIPNQCITNTYRIIHHSRIYRWSNLEVPCYDAITTC